MTSRFSEPRRSLRACLIALGVILLVPHVALAVGFSLDQVAVNHIAHAELGSGIGGGDTCRVRVGTGSVTTDPCGAENRLIGNQSTEIPTGTRSFVEVSVGPGANRVNANAGGNLTFLRASRDIRRIHGRGTFLTGSMGGSAVIRDSRSDEPDHPSASASLMLDDSFDITVPTATFLVRVSMIDSGSIYGITNEGLFEIVDLSTGDTLLSLSERVQLEEVDLSDYAGKQLRFSLQAHLEIAGPENFRTGESLRDRGFTESQRVSLIFREIPEPITLTWLGWALLVGSMRRLRD